MRPEFSPMDVRLDDTPGVLSEGDALVVDRHVNHTVQVTGTLTDLRLEASNDGVVWVELEAFSAPGIYTTSLLAFQLFRIRTEAFTDADIAELLGVGGTFALVGGETLNVIVDGVAVAVAFIAGDDTAAEVAARIDAACVLAGLAVGTCTVTGGQLDVVGAVPGGSIEVVSGTASATIGLTNGTTVDGQQADVPEATYGGLDMRAE